MLRPGVLVVCLWLLASTWARAADLPRYGGMYPVQGGQALALLDSDIEVTVRGPIVEAVVTQKFQNRSDQTTEATYVFPLPVDAAVSAMWIVNGTRTIRSSIEKRDEAQRRYEAAVRAGMSAAVLDQERPDVFTQTVSAIPAKGVVTVMLRYDTVARYRDGTWELVLPLVVAPRFVPGAATSRPTTGTGRAPDTDRAPDASRITPAGAPGAGGRTDVRVTFVDKADDVTSVTHDLSRTGNVATLVDPKSDHDLIVRWKTPATAAGWVEQGRDGGYAAVIVEAPGPPPRKPGQRWVLALDRSAVAQGDADAVARPLVRQLVSAMAAADRVQVAGSDAIPWSAGGDALRTLEERWNQPAGAFDLTRVLGAIRPGGAGVLLVSGGLVADDRAAIAAAKKLGVPVHVIGIGPAPARGLLAAIANATGGTSRYANPGDDLAALARATLADLAAPPAALAVTWGTLAASDIVPAALPRLASGEAILVLARVKTAHTANVRTRGDLFAVETLPAARAVDGATTTQGALARRWARNRLDEMLAGSAAPDVVAAHALRYGLVSPYTSMVAIGTEVIVQGGVKRSTAIPVSVPAGMKWQAVKQQQLKSETATADRPAGGETRVTNKQTPRPDAVAPVTPTAPRPMEDAIGSSAGSTDDAIDAESDESMRSAPAPRYAYAETISATSWSGGRHGRLRITPYAGAGLARFASSSSALLQVGSRLEYGTTTLLGVDASLWFVGDEGVDVQGRTMISFARRLARFLELGLAAGLHLGAGTGPAGSASLRLHLPPRGRVAAYLRYDGALLVDERVDERRGQHTVTLGIEWRF